MRSTPYYLYSPEDLTEMGLLGDNLCACLDDVATFVRVVSKNMAWLAGGCIVDALIGNKIKDFDVFVSTQPGVDSLIARLHVCGQEQKKDRNTRHTVFCTEMGVIDVTHGLYPGVEQCLDTFDIDVSAMAYIDGWVIAREKSLKNLKQRKFEVIRPNNRSAERVERYRKKGLAGRMSHSARLSDHYAY